MIFRIVYQTANGGVAVVKIPPVDTMQEAIALAVPAGAPYKLVDSSLLPADLTYRDFWTFDINEPSGIVVQVPTSADLDAKAQAYADELLAQSKDGFRALGETLAEVVYRVSNGQIPNNITEQQARTWVRDTFRDKYRGLL